MLVRLGGCPGPGQTVRRKGKWGDHENSILFIGRVSEQVQLYGGKLEGEVRLRRTETGKSNIINKELQDHWGGRRLLPGRPPPTHLHSQLLPSSQVDRSELSITRTLVRQLWAAR